MVEPRDAHRLQAHDEDAEAVRRVLAGDVSAFEGIVRRWQGRLVNVAWRFCRDRTMAEDLAQEAFVKAFKSLDTFRAESAFSTWLTAVALNTCRSALRERKPAAIPIDLVPAVATQPDGLTTMEESEQAESVRRAVMTLPARYREALVVYYLEERDLGESARVLGVPAGTLKARLHRGRELLKRRLSARIR